MTLPANRPRRTSGGASAGWRRVRDELRRPEYKGHLGRQIGLRIAEEIPKWCKRKRQRFYHCGSWSGLFARLGLSRPCGKAGRAAMRLLDAITPLDGLPARFYAELDTLDGPRTIDVDLTIRLFGDDDNWSWCDHE